MQINQSSQISTSNIEAVITQSRWGINSNTTETTVESHPDDDPYSFQRVREEIAQYI